jgi:hypothetical protein
MRFRDCQLALALLSGARSKLLVNPGPVPDDSKEKQVPKRIRKTLAGVMAFAALAVGAAGIAAATGSGATSTSGTSAAASAPSGRAGSPGPALAAANAPGTASHEDAERAVSGQAAGKAQAAAVARIGGGKAGMVTTDLRGDGYEVTVTKTDGSKVELHLDSSFEVQSGPPMGRRPGGASPSGGHPGPPPPSGHPGAPPSGQASPAG